MPGLRLPSLIARNPVRLLSNRSGNVAAVFAIALPVLLCASGAAVEYSNLVHLRIRLQAAADAAAIGAASELRLAQASQTKLSSLAQEIAIADLIGAPATPTVSTAFPDSRTVQVSVGLDAPSVMGLILYKFTKHIQASATARLTSSSKTPTCVLVLDQSADRALSMSGGILTSTACAVYSNSKSSSGMSLSGSSTMISVFSCSAGGAAGRIYLPTPLTDCPITPDPLSFRTPPSSSGCTHQNLKITGGTRQLFPGTYCGGLSIEAGAFVTLASGIYIIKNGGLSVTGPSTMLGTNVGFYLTGTNAVLTFNNSSTITLTAPNSGVMAGMLFWEDKNVIPLQQHSIISNNARLLLGTIYLPQGILAIQANAPVADLSAYTVIVARRLTLSNNPNLVLNVGYSATDIPVPNGLGPSSKTVLVQ